MAYNRFGRWEKEMDPNTEKIVLGLTAIIWVGSIYFLLFHRLDLITYVLLVAFFLNAIIIIVATEEWKNWNY